MTHLPPGWKAHPSKTKQTHPEPKPGDWIYLKNAVANNRQQFIGGVYEVRKTVSDINPNCMSIWKTDLRLYGEVDRTGASVALFYTEDWLYVSRDQPGTINTITPDGGKGNDVFYVNAIRVKNGYKGQVLARNKGTTVQDLSTDLIVWESDETYQDDSTVEPSIQGRVLAEQAAQSRIDKYLVEAFATP